MKRILFILLVLFAAVFYSCSVNKYLPPGERLYRGHSVKIEKDAAVKTRTKKLKNEIAVAIQPRPNKFFLGQPWKVWWWYKIGPPKREKGLKAFFRKRLGEPPVLSSRVNAPNTAENIVGRLDNLGYFHSSAQGDTVNTKSYTRARYTVQVQPQYHINEITWVSDSSALLKQLQRIQQQPRGLLKKGKPYNLDEIAAERDRIDLVLKNRGFYYFNPDYLMAYADTTAGDHSVNLFLNIKASTPEMAKHRFRINRINVFPNYSLASDALDTSKYGFKVFDTLHIRDTQNVFKPQLFANTITYRPGRIYSARSQNATLNRFIGLGAFKFVKNRFEIEDSVNHKMNVHYYLTPAKKRSIQASIDGFSKENNFLGVGLSTTWKNRNAFRGAEQLSIKGVVSAELSYADSLRRNNNFRFGGEVSLRMPRYAIPFLNIRENYIYPPNTNIVLGYELLRKQLFYTKNLMHARYDFTWKPRRSTSFTFAPFSVSYLRASNVSDSFYKQAAIDPSLLLNINSEAILGTYFSYTYSPSRARDRNKWIFSASLDLSGNLAGLITGAKDFRQKTIFGTPFAQFVKTDFDLHYTRTLSPKLAWANRLQVGLGFPYNNSALLPFTKQYIIGGSSSIRGFTVRSVGPGSYRPTLEDQQFFQIIGGDFKLLTNSELRFPISGRLKGAVFADVGNIWTKDTIQFGKPAQLSKNWWKELAVASGFGIRFDATVILIRVDLGIPLRKPYLPDGERWVIKDINLASGAWRRENLMLNIALGYPF